MKAKIRNNERSCVIELISTLNIFLQENNLKIKKVGGESSIRSDKSTMFPDVILYGDEAQSIILQGWEAKMPDVPIENSEFIQDAQRKAIALNLDSCLIWNFRYASLYLRKKESDEFYLYKQWNKTSHIHTRQDVEYYKKEWKNLLIEIVLELNELFADGLIHHASLGKVIAKNIISLIINRNKSILAAYLKEQAVLDTRIGAFIDDWWMEIQKEYEHDEKDKYCAYSKHILLSWSNKIVFAHLLKRWQEPAKLVNKIDFDMTPFKANEIFNFITSKCDFFNIFSAIEYDHYLPQETWEDLIEVSLFLRNSQITNIQQNTLQDILETTVSTAKREINGQYTTPEELAKILVLLTVKNWKDQILDPCCGTGTIIKEVLSNKKKYLKKNEAVGTTWASDKNRLPLQITSLSLASHDTINIPNKIFQHNILSLKSGELISIVNPKDGTLLNFSVPKFDTIVSNLPFVSFENIPDDDIELISKLDILKDKDKRLDLYEYIILTLFQLLSNNGKLGLITSNSWLGTISGEYFVKKLITFFDIEQVHLSGNGKWFKNADVQTTILLLKKKINNEDKKSISKFYLWQKKLEEFQTDENLERILINSSILGKEIDKNVVSLCSYDQKTISKIKNLNLSYNSFFHKVDWIVNLENKIIPLSNVFDVMRGSRRGWDPLFYPKQKHHIENKYLKKVLFNCKNVKSLIAVPDSDAFCCNKTIEELKQASDNGALSWIAQFQNQVNGVKKPLPEVLKRRNMQWYELKDNEVVDICTMMNPDKRLFFAKFKTPSFINQRLIGLKTKKEFPDVELNHALLNSILTLFYIEASGFGRGQGVLDINSTNISSCRILNPKLINRTNRKKILDAFKPLLKRDIKPIKEELTSQDRITFEKIVLNSFGLGDYFEKIQYSLISLYEARISFSKKTKTTKS